MRQKTAEVNIKLKPSKITTSLSKKPTVQDNLRNQLLKFSHFFQGRKVH